MSAFRDLVCLAVVTIVTATAPLVLAQTARNSPVVQSDLPPLSKPVVEVAAFRVAPVAESGMSARSKNLLPGGVTLPPPAAGGRKGERIIEVRAQKGESWEDLLRRIANVLSTRLPAGTAQIRQVSMPQLLPGKYLRIKLSADELMEIEYMVTPQEAYALLLSGATPQVRPIAGDARLIENMRADPSKASLFTATDAIGLPESIALQLTEIFAGEVDFLRELHQGYRCAIVYEAHYREGFIENSGRILAAELEVGKRMYRAYYAQDGQGRGAYFDGNGKSTLRLFRRSPLEFTRVTSDFTLARFHPILGVWRAHRGVDYAAPTGAKVMSVADGVVEFVGQRGGYGNLIVMRHHEKFLTYYAHLNAFAPNLAVGDKVAQGQIIGFVGMTGLATGPHLHFEFHVRSVTGEWTAVPAPDVINTTLFAASGFNGRVQSYRDSLAVAGRGNVLFLE
jgi:murein DD-endopeptidase MepM/ murein hydrolase activator NlpD